MAENNGKDHPANNLSMSGILDSVHFSVSNPRRITSLSDEVYEHILKEIVFPDDQDRLKIGGKITESMIAKDLQVSNGPVRDAISRLRREGWIITLHNRGSYIVDFTLPENSREIYRFRLSVEAGAFYTLAKNINDTQLKVLENLTIETKTSLERADFMAYRKADAQFHLTVIEMAGGHSLRELAAPKLLQWFAVSRFILKDM
ncbi:MAG: GntR family transcriptional regulator, partial [Anaerohalosphaera sp.]|nr:GntR family transcriptional regulator [Anaerohalosphaera sp.]